MKAIFFIAIISISTVCSGQRQATRMTVAKLNKIVQALSARLDSLQGIGIGASRVDTIFVVSTIPEEMNALAARVTALEAIPVGPDVGTVPIPDSIRNLPAALQNLRNEFQVEKGNIKYVYRQAVDLRETLNALPELKFVGFKTSKYGSLITVTNAVPLKRKRKSNK